MSVSVAVSDLFTRTFLSVSVFIIFCSATEAQEPETNCTVQIISEGESLTCECRAPPSFATNVTLSWPGHSNTTVLTVDSVRREDNGTVFTCLMERQGMENKTATHTLLVAYGPTNKSNVTIMGPSSFTTDGTRNLTLTCVVTDVFPLPHFTWSGLCTSSTDTCTFMPQLNQTGHPVICSAINAVNSSLGTQSASICLDLEYPPPEPPRITTSINKTVFSSGDSLTCTVRGGKPTVTSVIFHCTNPDLSDKEDVTEDTSVMSSSVVVDTSKATYSPMHCLCSAVWGPEQDLYANNSNRAFLLDYKGTVNNFTANNKPGLTVQEQNLSSVEFFCDTITRSPANLSLYKRNNGTLLLPTNTSIVDGTESNRTTITSSLSDVRCEDTGTFVCQVDNGFPDPNSKMVHLNVTCIPRNLNMTGSGGNPPTLTKQGLDVIVVANPVPHTFYYTHTGKQTVERDGMVPSVEIQTACVVHAVKHYIVTCSIKPLAVPDKYTGFYVLSISNGLGELNFTFKILDAVSPDPKITIPLIAGCVAAGVAFFSIVVCICIFWRRKGPTVGKHSSGTDERRASYAESIMIRNSIYESASVLELSRGPLRTSSRMEPTGHYASVGPAEPNHEVPPTNGSSRTPAYEDAGYAVAGFGLDARLTEQPHSQPTTGPAVSPAPENHVYAVVNKPKKT